MAAQSRGALAADPERLDRLRGMQAQVMSVGADLVKPGGRMVYVVCSLLDAEGSDQIAAFWRATPAGRSRLLPK